MAHKASTEIAVKLKSFSITANWHVLVTAILLWIGAFCLRTFSSFSIEHVANLRHHLLGGTMIKETNLWVCSCCYDCRKWSNVGKIPLSIAPFNWPSCDSIIADLCRFFPIVIDVFEIACNIAVCMCVYVELISWIFGRRLIGIGSWAAGPASSADICWYNGRWQPSVMTSPMMNNRHNTTMLKRPISSFASHLPTESFTFAFIRNGRNSSLLFVAFDVGHNWFHTIREYFGEIWW